MATLRAVPLRQPSSSRAAGSILAALAFAASGCQSRPPLTPSLAARATVADVTAEPRGVPAVPFVATPAFHHWHHAAEPEAIDCNFAVHLPFIDRVFGTAYEPDRWPARYGIAGDPVPEGFRAQLVYPFRTLETP